PPTASRLLFAPEAETGVTALMTAVSQSQPESAAFLLARGANVNARTSVRNTPLLFASQYCDVTMSRLLISKGAQVDAATTEGRTSLMNAVARDRRDLLLTLLTSGANINARTSTGETASMVSLELYS